MGSDVSRENSKNENVPKALLNLKPGQTVQYMNLFWRFLLPGENVQDDITFVPDICNCINPAYTADKRIRSRFQIIVYCKKREFNQNNQPIEYNNVIALCFADKQLYFDTYTEKIYTKGLKIHVICAEMYSIHKLLYTIEKHKLKGKQLSKKDMEIAVMVETKIGLLLRLIIMRFAVNRLKLKNIYLDAASEDLVRFYKTIGFTLFDVSCKSKSATEKAFNEYVNVPDEFFTKHSYLKCSNDWPMKMCDVDIDKVTKTALNEFYRNLPEALYWYKKEGTTCLGNFIPYEELIKNKLKLNNIETLYKSMQSKVSI